MSPTLVSVAAGFAFYAALRQLRHTEEQAELLSLPGRIGRGALERLRECLELDLKMFQYALERARESDESARLIGVACHVLERAAPERIRLLEEMHGLIAVFEDVPSGSGLHPRRFRLWRLSLLAMLAETTSPFLFTGSARFRVRLWAIRSSFALLGRMAGSAYIRPTSWEVVEKIGADYESLSRAVLESVALLLQAAVTGDERSRGFGHLAS